MRNVITRVLPVLIFLAALLPSQSSGFFSASDLFAPLTKIASGKNFSPSPETVREYWLVVRINIREDGSCAYEIALGCAEYEYGPFGEAIRDPGPVGKENPFRFSTRYHDDETGLIYYGYRYYNPETGKWLSQEPLGEAASLNLYAFCANDPVNHVDVLGLYEKSVQVLNLGTLILDPHQSGHYTQNMGLLEQYGGIVGRALRGAIADYEFAFTAYGYDSVEYQRALKRAGSFRRELKMVQALHARFESEYDFIYNGVAGSNLAGADFHHNQFDLRVNSDVALLKHGNDVNLFKGLILEEATGLAGTTLIGRLIRGAGTASAVTPKAVQGGSFLDKFPRINPRNYGWDPAFGSRAGMLGDLKMFKYKGATNNIALRSQRTAAWQSGFGKPSDGLGQLVKDLPKGDPIRNQMAQMLRQIRASGGAVGKNTNLGRVAGVHYTQSGAKTSVFQWNPNTLRAADFIEEQGHWMQIQKGMVGTYSTETLEILSKQRVLQTPGLSNQLRFEFLHDIRQVRAGNYVQP